jgi:hypothetical protein
MSGKSMADDPLTNFLTVYFPLEQGVRTQLLIPASTITDGTLRNALNSKLAFHLGPADEGVIHFRRNPDGSYEIKSYIGNANQKSSGHHSPSSE